MTRDNVVRDWNQLEEMDDSAEMAETSEPEVRETRETAEVEAPETGDGEEVAALTTRNTRICLAIPDSEVRPDPLPLNFSEW